MILDHAKTELSKPVKSVMVTGKSMNSINEVIYHRAFGKHSNIPSCCVEFFIFEWDRNEGWRNEGNWYHQAISAASWGYVPCPQCLGKGRKVKIKLCVNECGGEHREDFLPKEIPNAY